MGGFLQRLRGQGRRESGEDFFCGGQGVGVEAVDPAEVFHHAADHPDVLLADLAGGRGGGGGGQRRGQRFAGHRDRGAQGVGVGDQPGGGGGVEVPELLDQPGGGPVAGRGGGVGVLQLADPDQEPVAGSAGGDDVVARRVEHRARDAVPSMGQW